MHTGSQSFRFMRRFRVQFSRELCAACGIFLALVFVPAAVSGPAYVRVSGRRLPDVELVDQHGQKRRFCSDVMLNKIAVVNTIFTTCTTICPLMGSNFAALRKMLGPAGDGKIRLVSISLDPEVDTPARLDAWSRKFGETRDWTLLTGPKADIDLLLKALQLFTAEKLAHQPVILVGGAGVESWATMPAFGPAQTSAYLHKRID